LKVSIPVLAVVLGLALVAGGVSAAPLSAPRYTRGDFWTYAVRGNLSLPTEFSLDADTILAIQGNTTLSVISTDSASTTITEFSDLQMSTDFTIQGRTYSLLGEFSINRTSVWRPGEAGEGGNYTGVARFNLTFNSQGLSFTVRVRMDMEARVTQNTLSFPIDVGDRGRTVHTIENRVEIPDFPGGTMDLMMTTTRDYMVRPLQQVTVPAGTYTAVRLDSWANTTYQGDTGGIALPSELLSPSHIREYYSEDVGNAVKVEYFGSGGQKIMEENLVTYRYAEGPRRIVPLYSQPAFWVAGAIAGVGVVLAAILVGRRRRYQVPPLAPLPPPPPEAAGIPPSPPPTGELQPPGSPTVPEAPPPGPDEGPNPPT
jgi:hypothetical protein